MTTIHFTEGRYTAEFLISESEQPNYSREVVTLLSGQNLSPGTVLGRITTGAPTPWRTPRWPVPAAESSAA